MRMITKNEIFLQVVFSSKCDQIRGFLRIWSHLHQEILNEKLHFMCSVLSQIGKRKTQHESE